MAMFDERKIRDIGGFNIPPDARITDVTVVPDSAASRDLIRALQTGTFDGGVLLPTDPKARKAIPLASGVLDYFPAALAEVAKVSMAGNIQHNGPDAELRWSRDKSNDQSDTIIRHFMERGGFDTDGQRHSAKLVWRALALLQLEMEAAGAPKARGAR